MRCLLVLIALAAHLSAKDIPVADAAGWPAALAAAQPGDRLILRQGEWRDARLVFSGRGTAGAPITLQAATPGKTILTGQSTLGIAGEHLVVDGLFFQDPDPTLGSVIQFRAKSNQLARDCRLTNCAIVSTRPATGTATTHWLGLYGTENQVDHCTFQGKSGPGTTFVVWLGDGATGKHRIDHNYFGPREKLGANGGETMRVGDSQTSMLAANCIVERNLFDRCNGELECISNKSRGNIYRDNTFLAVSGTLTLRHGNGCLVENNVFLGNGAKGTGGIRIIGEDHTIRGNYLERLTGDGARAGLCLMMGIPHSPAHRYFQVQRALVENNTLADCEHSIVIGLADDENATLAPAQTIFRGNQVSAPRRPVVSALCSLDGITWQQNRFAGKTLGIPPRAGIETEEPKIVPLKPISRSEVGPTW